MLFDRAPQLAHAGTPAGMAQSGDMWNRIDFFIVLMSWVGLAPGVGNVQFLRMVRVLRPLRSMNRIPGMGLLFSALLDSLKPLMDVAALLLLVILLFGTVGINLFQGRLHSRCVWPTNPVEAATIGWDDRPCNSDAPIGRQCLALFDNSTAANGTFVQTICVTNFTLFANPNVTGGWVHFDHFGGAFVTIFQVITQEGWTDIMYIYEDAFNTYVSTAYFCSLVIIGNWFMLSFFVAVLAEEYEHQKHVHKVRDMAKQLVSRQVRSDMRARLDATQGNSGSSDSTPSDRAGRAGNGHNGSNGSKPQVSVRNDLGRLASRAHSVVDRFHPVVDIDALG
jgi:hypothetical protein